MMITLYRFSEDYGCCFFTSNSLVVLAPVPCTRSPATKNEEKQRRETKGKKKELQMDTLRPCPGAWVYKVWLITVWYTRVISVYKRETMVIVVYKSLHSYFFLFALRVYFVLLLVVLFFFFCTPFFYYIDSCVLLKILSLVLDSNKSWPTSISNFHLWLPLCLLFLILFLTHLIFPMTLNNTLFNNLTQFFFSSFYTVCIQFDHFDFLKLLEQLVWDLGSYF